MEYITVRMIVDKLQFHREILKIILSDELGMKTISEKFVLWILIAEQKLRRFDIATDLLSNL